MPMKYGPVIAGGSWYSMFFVSKTPITNLDALWLIGSYVLFLAFVYFVFHSLKNRFTVTVSTNPPAQPTKEGA